MCISFQINALCFGERWQICGVAASYFGTSVAGTSAVTSGSLMVSSEVTFPPTVKDFFSPHVSPQSLPTLTFDLCNPQWYGVTHISVLLYLLNIRMAFSRSICYWDQSDSLMVELLFCMRLTQARSPI